MKKVETILVTGGAGFIGSHLVEGLLANDICKTVIVIDTMRSGSLNNLQKHIDNPNLIVLNLEVTDYEAMASTLKQYNVDIVCHLATSLLVASIEDPIAAFSNIVDMQKVLVECQRQGLYDRLISFSTSEVYGSSDELFLDEQSRLAPRTPYASAKAAADLLLESYAKTWPDKINYTIVRPFNNYGPRKKVLTGAGIIPRAIVNFSKGETLYLVDGGEASRDFIFVEDTVRAVISIIQNPEKAKNQLFVLATGKSRKISEIADDIAKLMHVEGLVENTSSRPGDVSYLRGDASKIKRVLGFEPTTRWEDGLKICIDFYSTHHDLVK